MLWTDTKFEICAGNEFSEKQMTQLSDGYDVKIATTIDTSPLSIPIKGNFLLFEKPLLPNQVLPLTIGKPSDKKQSAVHDVRELPVTQRRRILNASSIKTTACYGALASSSMVHPTRRNHAYIR